MFFDLESKKHYYTVLDRGKPGSWDENETSFCHAFVDPDEPKKTYLFYTSSNLERSQFAIGLAISHDGRFFKKVNENPLFDGSSCPFYANGVLAPNVVKVDNRYYMTFTGVSSKENTALGIAYAEDPKGPWNFISELIRPNENWEGKWIEVGPGSIGLGDELLIYYSNLRINLREALFRWLRSPYLTKPTSYRYLKRRIGILRVKIGDLKKSDIKAHRYKRNPLRHLNGKRGSWNESLFCPGTLQLEEHYYLFPACSTYSIGFPYRQYIGMITSKSPFFEKEYLLEGSRKIIDGPFEKTDISPTFQGEIAIDTPSPTLKSEEEKLFLYYTVMDRKNHIDKENERWKIALTTFKIIKKV